MNCHDPLVDLALRYAKASASYRKLADASSHLLPLQLHHAVLKLIIAAKAENLTGRTSDKLAQAASHT